MINRSEANRALAKAIAYKECGKDAKADVWVAKLVHMLKCADILRSDYVEPSLVDNSIRLMAQ